MQVLSRKDDPVAGTTTCLFPGFCVEPQYASSMKKFFSTTNHEAFQDPKRTLCVAPARVDLADESPFLRLIAGLNRLELAAKPAAGDQR